MSGEVHYPGALPFMTVLLILLFTTGIAHAQTDVDLFNSAHKHRKEQEWLRAVDLYQRLRSSCPHSPFADDAAYWTAYCVEKSGRNLADAFIQYGEMPYEYPHSSWADDAQVHQIYIAGTLALSGLPSYSNFLKEKLSHSNYQLRLEAKGSNRLGLFRHDFIVGVPAFAELK